MTPPRCVFIVDDDPSARRGLARLLRTADFDVFEFASAREFLDALEPESSGCMVMDARMPGMSGEGLHEELVRRGVQLPIIVVTADDDPATKEKARKMGAAGFFRKPVDGTALLDAVSWALSKENMDGKDD